MYCHMAAGDLTQNSLPAYQASTLTPELHSLSEGLLFLFLVIHGEMDLVVKIVCVTLAEELRLVPNTHFRQLTSTLCNSSYK